MQDPFHSDDSDDDFILMKQPSLSALGKWRISECPATNTIINYNFI